jgi:hypothetical protein
MATLRWLARLAGGLTAATAWLPLCDDRCRVRVIVLSAAALLLTIAVEAWRYGGDWTRWDMLLISGVAALVIALIMVGQVRPLLLDCLDRLQERGAIGLDDDGLKALIGEIDRSADAWGRVLAPVVAGLIALVFAIALAKDFAFPRLLLGIVESGLGYIAGGYIGQMVRYGWLGSILKSRDVKVTIIPWHGDQVGGLSPVGRLFFRQAMVIAVPALFLAFWSVAIPAWPRDYSRWTEGYLLLLAVVILLELAAFFLPLWSFHRIMLAQKAELQRRIDNFYKEHRQEHEVLRDADQAEVRRANEQRELLAEEYRAVEDLPTWPIDMRVRLRFGINNVLLIVPLLSELGHKNFGWPSIPSSLFKLAEVMFA